MLSLLFICFAVVGAEQVTLSPELMAQHEKRFSELKTLIESRKEMLSMHYDPLLVVVIMVKDEATVIEQTLQPYVDAQVDHFLVLDTGSTDATIEVTEAFFKKNNIKHGVIKQEPFVDFSVSRNCALDLARQEFPKACFLIMPDAEWIVQNPGGLMKFCDEHKNDVISDAYDMRILNWHNLDYFNPRLIRSHSDAHFEFPIHEYLAVKTLGDTVPLDVYFSWNSTKLGQEKSNQRWHRDLKILTREYEKDSTNHRTVFYLAQTYDCLGDTDNAKKYYKQRAEMGGWYEEAFQGCYRLAQVHARCNEWESALFFYLQAYSMCPHRIEPLVKIAQYYLSKDNFATAYLFAARATEVPYPADDKLFVERRVYDYDRYEVLTRAAWYIQEYEVGQSAAELALLGSPEEYREIAKSNLSFYLNRKK